MITSKCLKDLLFHVFSSPSSSSFLLLVDIDSFGREVISKMTAQKERRRSLDKYLREREECKRTEKQRLEEENRKIEEYARQQRERQESHQQEKRAIQGERDKLVQKVIFFLPPSSIKKSSVCLMKCFSWQNKYKRSRGR